MIENAHQNPSNENGLRKGTELEKRVRELSAEVSALKEAGLDSLTDTLAQWLSAQYAATAARVSHEASGGLPLDVLHGLSLDIVSLRKGDHSATRLKMEREWLEIEREKSRERMEQKFEEWLKRPEVRDRFSRSNLSEEERAQRIREIFQVSEPAKRGLTPETLAEIERATKIL